MLIMPKNSFNLKLPNLSLETLLSYNLNKSQLPYTSYK